MKQYKNALLALHQSGTPNALQNKYAKISVDATDDVLKALALEMSVMYSYHLKRGWSRDNRGWTEEQKRTIPANNSSWEEMRQSLTLRYKAYVEQRIAEGKPEWMVMAEKHGWRPY